MSEAYRDIETGIPAQIAARRACELSKGSWEYGTCAEALLELHNPELSVFGHDPFPRGRLPRIKTICDIPSLVYATQYIRTDSSTLVHDDDVIADPASIGVSANLMGVLHEEYAGAAHRQAKYLLETAARFPNGAISHREGVLEMWADFVYMVPPFLAYHAVATESTELLHAADEQCKLYHERLSNKTPGRSAGLWRHIIGAKHEDLGYWSTGNGWAAAGMARVLATMLKWQKSQTWIEDAQHLKECIRDIVDGAMRTDDDTSSGLLRNYLDDCSWWGEISGTALLASVVYRMAILAPDMFGSRHLEWADHKRLAISRHIDTNTGLGAPAVNPLDHLQREKLWSGSPEGQSFLVILHAAYRDWIYATR